MDCRNSEICPKTYFFTFDFSIPEEVNCYLARNPPNEPLPKVYPGQTATWVWTTPTPAPFATINEEYTAVYSIEGEFWWGSVPSDNKTDKARPPQ